MFLIFGVYSFEDESIIANWAIYSVKLLSRIRAKDNGESVKGSADKDQLAQIGTYSREQAIISFSRLLNNIND